MTDRAILNAAEEQAEAAAGIATPPQANQSTQPVILDEFGLCDTHGFAEFVELSRNGISRRYKTWGQPYYTGKTGPDMVIKD